jgi:hypothetical protein
MKLLAVVAILQDFPEKKVEKGQVGTVVEELDASNVLIEFADTAGVAYAILPIPVNRLIELKYMPAQRMELEQLLAQHLKPDGKKTPLERLAEHGDTVLKIIGVLFAIAIVWLFISLKFKFDGRLF